MVFRRRVPAFVMLLAVLAGALWVFARRDEPGPSGGPPSADSSGAESGAVARPDAARDPAIRPKSFVLVRGTVTDGNGAPIGGARVELLPLETPGASAKREIRAEAGGTFAFEDVAEGESAGVSASAEGFEPALVAPLPPPRDGVVEVAIVLRRDSGIRGRVTSEDGAAIEGARVTIAEGRRATTQGLSSDDDLRLRRAVDETRTDATGAFQLELETGGAWDVDAEKPGFSFAVAESVRVRPGAFARVDLVLVPARDLVGEVVDAAGNPVVGASVGITHQQPRGRGFSRTSDARGRFDVPMPEPRPSQQVDIHAAKPGVGVGNATFLLQRLPEVLRVTLVRTRALTCRFFPDDRSPAPPDMRFQITTNAGDRHFVFVRKTDASGVGLIADFPEGGQVFIVIDDPAWCFPCPGCRGIGHLSGGGRPAAIAPTGDTTLNVPLTRTGSVAGTVIDRTTGKPVPGIPVVAMPGPGLPVFGGRHYRARGETDSDGRFRIRNVQRSDLTIIPGTTQYLLWPDGWNGEQVGGRGGSDPRKHYASCSLADVPSVEDVVVKVVASGTVEGLVVDTAGRPVEGAVVDPGLEPLDRRNGALIDDDSYRDKVQAQTDSAGRFVLAGLYPGPSARVRAARPRTPAVWSEPFVMEPGATVKGITIALHAGKTLVVEVLGADGAPVPHALAIISEGGGHDHAVRRPLFSRATGKDGCATFEHLGSDRVTVSFDPVTLPRGQQVDPKLDRVLPLGPADPTRVTIRLVGGAEVPGKK